MGMTEFAEKMITLEDALQDVFDVIDGTEPEDMRKAVLATALFSIYKFIGFPRDWTPQSMLRSDAG